MPSRERVLLVFPTAWDRRQLALFGPLWSERYQVLLAEPGDSDFAWDLDVVRYIDELARRHGGELSGVTSSSDYPGPMVAAALARRLGLPGADPAAVVESAHKYYARQRQRAVAPEATPPFRLIDPRRPEAGCEGLEFPCFLKPVKGSFSVLTGEVRSAAELAAFLARPEVDEFLRDYVAAFNQLVRALTPLELDGSYFLAEGLLRGAQATVEGYIRQDEVEFLGIVDSIFHPGTASFARFEYPSALPEPVQHRMLELAERVVRAARLEGTLFNLELVYDAARDALGIIELNPRMCSQFADLYQRVDGTHGHEVALDLATGRRPRLRRRQGSAACAASFPLRTFVPVRVARAPDAARIAEVESTPPGALVLWECEPGEELVDFARYQDGASLRYGVINLGARSRDALAAELRRADSALAYRLDPL
jgi:hypothetical protein